MNKSVNINITMPKAQTDLIVNSGKGEYTLNIAGGRGREGKSAYEVAVANGFVGTSFRTSGMPAFYMLIPGLTKCTGGITIILNISASVRTGRKLERLMEVTHNGKSDFKRRNNFIKKRYCGEMDLGESGIVQR